MDIYTLEAIETPRLVIRPLKEGDHIPINAAIQSALPELQRWMPWSKDPSMRSTETFVRNGIDGWAQRQSKDFPMVVIHKADGEIIAASGFNEKSEPGKGCFELGYWIHSKYRNKGLVTEYVIGLSKFALQGLKARHVQICTQVENSKSIAVAERCGFKLKSTIQGHCIDCVTGKLADSYVFVCERVSDLPELEVVWS